MHIWLMRHGEAVDTDRSFPDADRPLSDVGRRQVAGLARWLKDHEPVPDLILHSPLRRAVETGQLLRDELGGVRCEESHLLAMGMRCELLLARLAAQAAQSVVCVGHQPDIGRCLAEMLGGGRFAVAPGTIAGIEFPQVITPGGGQLRWLLDPRWF